MLMVGFVKREQSLVLVGLGMPITTRPGERPFMKLKQWGNNLYGTIITLGDRPKRRAPYSRGKTNVSQADPEGTGHGLTVMSDMQKGGMGQSESSSQTTSSSRPPTYRQLPSSSQPPSFIQQQMFSQQRSSMCIDTLVVIRVQPVGRGRDKDIDRGRGAGKGNSRKDRNTTREE
ncbi:hypothetical protein FXO38_20090 [Capsicum annuum]|nr:hypothetical protein FXO38_20090 [Capsicum annuum]